MNPADFDDVPLVLVYRWASSTPNSYARARAVLCGALEQLDCEGELATDVVLAASELVANAIEHAWGPYEMRLRYTADELVCEVEDRDPRIPNVPDLPAEVVFSVREDDRGGGLDALCELLTERGRGLRIVNMLAHGGAWGFRNDSKTTKTAWLALPVISNDCKPRQTKRNTTG